MRCALNGIAHGYHHLQFWQLEVPELQQCLEGQEEQSKGSGWGGGKEAKRRKP